MKGLIQQLTEAYGPSGREEQIRSLIAGLVAGHADAVRTDAMGNLIVLKKGTGGGKRVMIAAHMDEIGLMVTFVDAKGFLRVSPLGGVFARAALGQRVVFADGTTGVIGIEKWLQAAETPVWDKMFVDIGAKSAEGLPVGIGDAAVLSQPFVDGGERLMAKAMDDRAGCAVAIQALLELGETPNDVYFVFTVQEEVGTRGAAVAAFGIEPEVALSIDVTDAGDTPEAKPMAVELGGGPAIKLMDSGMLTHPGVKRWMVETAEQAGLAHQFEVLTLGSTDARAIQVSRAGVPAGCISIPCRYIHTPAEMVDAGDVRGCVDLLVALLAGPIEV